MKPSIRLNALLVLCILWRNVRVLLLLPLPATAGCDIITGKGCNLPSIKVPTLNDIKREASNCFSGGCDPAKIMPNWDGSSEMWG